MRRRLIFGGLILIWKPALGQVSAPPKSDYVTRLPASRCSTMEERPQPPAQAANWTPPDLDLLPAPGSEWWRSWISEIYSGLQNYKGLAVKITSKDSACNDNGKVNTKNFLLAEIFLAEAQSLSFTFPTNGRGYISLSLRRRFGSGDLLSASIAGSPQGQVLGATPPSTGRRPRGMNVYDLREAPFRPQDEVATTLRFWTLLYWISLSDLAERLGLNVPEQVRSKTLMKKIAL